MDAETVMVAVCCILSVSEIWASNPFPEDFVWGVSTSAYQIEGGWNASGKGVSKWDDISHNNPGFVIDGSTGDIACDSYHKYEEDVQMLKYLGVSHYRFSISWPRILPMGFSSLINQPGVDYYNNLIDELLENGIQPAITLYHWDIPLVYSALGGWANPGMVDQFTDYARLAFVLFGDRVKMWFTFNEPRIICQEYNYVVGNVSETYPTGVIEYTCTHTLLKAHAETYHMYNDEFRKKQNGIISLVLNFDWYEPGSDTAADLEAAETRRQFEFGWFANPIINGNYPTVMIDRINRRSRREGFSESRLPTLSPEDIARIRGTYDFLGINHYTTFLVRAIEEDPIGRSTYYKDMGTIKYQDPSWVGSSTEYLSLKVIPWGLRNLLNWVKKTYRDPDIYITECGYPDFGGVDDDERVDYYQKYINAALEAIVEDKVSLKGFFAWSLMDNFEWIQGYRMKFGLYSVDFNDPNRPRTAKKSAEFYRKYIKGSSANNVQPISYFCIILFTIYLFYFVYHNGSNA